MIRSDDTGSVEAMVLQKHDGLEEVTQPPLLHVDGALSP
jgi:hypothetical protein